ncbi:MAG TPA: hypothetical protein VGO21_03290 [Candidatus Paceibacterota bacterium]|jgi:hypothetical protein|nr:hypothetical protein [Candidatus Paceibacterota bacterium]
MRKRFIWLSLILFVFLFALFFIFPEFFGSRISYVKSDEIVKPTEKIIKIVKPAFPPLDTVAYDAKMSVLANNPPPKLSTTKIVKDPKTGKTTTVTVEPKKVVYPWPVKAVYPNPGALLPGKRIIAYYGNLYSKGMGVLGEYPEDIMLAKLEGEVKKWEAADSSTPVVPALHYIAVVAQGSPGADGKYRFRMPDSEINKVLAMAAKINGIVFLDIQVGFSNVQTEVPLLEKYLKMPQVHLAIDPEFSMKSGIRPGKVVGTFDATDVNFVAGYLAKIVKENNLPPKVLIVHRYTQKMVTNYKEIKPLPEVQILMNMDGWGGAAKKIGTYKNFIYPEPVQFTGFKLFYKNDISTGDKAIMTPDQVLKLSPKPIYIQYQ